MKKIIIPLYNFYLGNQIDKLVINDYEFYKHVPYKITFNRGGVNYSFMSSYFSFQGPLKREEPRHELLKLLAILKLSSEATPFSNIVIFRKNRMDYVPHFQIWRTKKKYKFAKPYYITNRYKQIFSRFFNHYENINCGNFAVYQFITADHNPYDDGMLLQYVSALEFLFVPDGDKGNIKQKLASRASKILGKGLNSEAEQSIFDFMKMAYKQRSNIVHGQGAPTFEYLLEALPVARNHCRTAINHFFEAGVLDDSAARLAHINS